MKKKVLLFPSLEGGNISGQFVKLLFREAKSNQAILFFDECDQIFLNRDKGGNYSTNMILVKEIEKFDGLCILATNRVQDLDEVVHQHITLAVEFHKPDYVLREQIWKRVLQSSNLSQDKDLNLSLLATQFEVTGGQIKNACLRSWSMMLKRGGTVVKQVDLMKAASEQMDREISSKEFEHRVIPTKGLVSMVLSPSVKEALYCIVQSQKAQSTLLGQWGFDKIHRAPVGTSALFTGPP